LYLHSTYIAMASRNDRLGFGSEVIDQVWAVISDTDYLDGVVVFGNGYASNL